MQTLMQDRDIGRGLSTVDWTCDLVVATIHNSFNLKPEKKY